MNFLAHCALAHDVAQRLEDGADAYRGLLAGAVIGDFVKGRANAENPKLANADEHLLRGIRLHRKIDAVSNHQPELKLSYEAFPAEYRRIAPILIDLLADHSLSRQWHHHYAQDLSGFANECYQAIDAYQHCLNDQAQRFYEYMRRVDLLANYHQWQHIERGIQSVMRRLSSTQEWQQVETVSRAAVPHNDKNFGQYYPQLRSAIVALQNW